jgi:hypothetical protein
MVVVILILLLLIHLLPEEVTTGGASQSIAAWEDAEDDDGDNAEEAYRTDTFAKALSGACLGANSRAWARDRSFDKFLADELRRRRTPRGPPETWIAAKDRVSSNGRAPLLLCPSSDLRHPSGAI